MLLIVGLKPTIRIVRLVQLGRRWQVQLVPRDQVNVFALVVPLQRPEARRLAVAVVLSPDLDTFPQEEVELGRRDHPVASSPARCGARVEVGLALERPEKGRSERRVLHVIGLGVRRPIAAPERTSRAFWS